jgi:hypothetical protein
MTELLKLLFPVIWSVKSYQETLRKLAAFLFWETYLLTFVLRTIPAIDRALESAENWGPFGKALSVVPHHEKLNLLGLILALLVACFSYAVESHDRISDVFGIRRRFDRNYILLPLAILTGAQLPAVQLNRVDVHRDSLMREVFYKYASDRLERPLVDRHDIERALEVWSWYWLLLEGAVLWLAGALVAGLFASYSLMNTLSWIAVALWMAALLYSLRLPRFARPQVEQIAANAQARQAVREAFGAL